MTAITSPTAWPRIAGIAVVLSLAVSVIVLAFAWPVVTSEPKDLPVAIVGPAQQVTAITEAAPDIVALTEVADRDAAVALIESREAYGAVILGAQPEVLTASAAGAAPEQVLGLFATELQGQLNTAAAAQAAAMGAEAPAITVTVTDVVPLADSDSRGLALLTSFFPILLGGLLGGVIISIAVAGAWRRVVTVSVYSVVAGFLATAVLQGWIGALQGNYLINSLGFSLAMLAIAAPIIGLASLIGRPGIALGPIVFLLFANPISASTQPVEFLLAPWGAIGQWFPPGASATLMRDLSYFPGADAAFAWLVLAGWAAVGIVLGLIGHARSHSTEPVSES